MMMGMEMVGAMTSCCVWCGIEPVCCNVKKAMVKEMKGLALPPTYDPLP